MGTWGVKIFHDDVACDVKDKYIELLRKGLTNQEVVDQMLEFWECEIVDPEDGPVFWFALADTQWRYGRLTEFVKEKAIESIEQDIQRWNNSGLGKKRKQELEKLKEKLNSPQLEEKKIVIPRAYATDWKNGDIYAYKFDSEESKTEGYYGKYAYFIKVDEIDWPPAAILPRVSFYNMISDNLLSLEEIVKYPYTPRWNRQPNYKKGVTFLENDLVILMSTSSRVIPKNKLTYIGNYPKCQEISNTGASVYITIKWKKFESYVIYYYNQWKDADL